MAEAWAVKFYNSKEWRDLRQRLIISRSYTCEVCGKNYIMEPYKLVGHHKVSLTPNNINDIAVSFNDDNVSIICKDCHDREHERFGYNGQHKVYLVYGSPCSGKTTYIQQVSERGDLIVDINEISRSISNCELYDKPDRLNKQVYAIRDLLIDHIRIRSGQWLNAFVVGGYPRKLERDQLAAKLKAELVFIEVTKEEAKIRAKSSRGTLASQYEKYIDKWFDSFQP